MDLVKISQLFSAFCQPLKADLRLDFRRLFIDVHREVALSNCLFQTALAGVKRHAADADANLQAVSTDEHGLANDFPEPPDNFLEIGARLAIEQDDEFIAAIAEYLVVLFKRSTQATAANAQDLVADFMAVVVVNRLEMIQIEKQDLHRSIKPIGKGWALHQLLQVEAVVQSGQRIGVHILHQVQVFRPEFSKPGDHHHREVSQHRIGGKAQGPWLPGDE